mmetsp:Transcript_77924/g.228473  ORF Transcript_77924/g.228473 Transcript_77924/m.228473 type:complete len:146 (+) Transcript_77924:33-470(+)
MDAKTASTAAPQHGPPQPSADVSKTCVHCLGVALTAFKIALERSCVIRAPDSENANIHIQSGREYTVCCNATGSWNARARRCTLDSQRIGYGISPFKSYAHFPEAATAARAVFNLPLPHPCATWWDQQCCKEGSKRIAGDQQATA